MNVIARRTLQAFWERYPRAEVPLKTWYALVSRVEWKTSADIKEMFGTNVDFVQDNRVIFDIGGNKFRVVVHVSYTFKAVMIKFVGTHKEYDSIDPRTVQ
jgi:mRNA interferase HigB